MDYKDILLICDIDGTLSNDESSLLPNVIPALEHFLSLGGAFTLATGRTPRSIRAFPALLNRGIPLILSNGAQIFNQADSSSLYLNTIPLEYIPVLIRLTLEFPQLGASAVAEEETLLVKRPAELSLLPPYLSDYVPRPLTHSAPPLCAFDFFGPQQLLLKARSRLAELVGDGLSITVSYSHCLDVMAAGVAKGDGLKRLKSMLPDSLSRRSTVSLGDGENDISLFEYSDYSFAVPNAHALAKKAACEVLPRGGSELMYALLNRLSSI